MYYSLFDFFSFSTNVLIRNFYEILPFYLIQEKVRSDLEIFAEQLKQEMLLNGTKTLSKEILKKVID